MIRCLQKRLNLETFRNRFSRTIVDMSATVKVTPVDESSNSIDVKRKSDIRSVEPQTKSKKQKIEPDPALTFEQLKGLKKNKRRKLVKQLCHEKHWENTKGKPLHMLYGKNSSAAEYILDSEYYFENGLRKVKPYFFDFNTFCKGRWIGKTIREVYQAEFRLYPYEHYENLRKQGRILLNLEPAESLNIKFKENDMLTSRIHRHEGAVLDAPIEIIEDSSKFLVVDKPSSIPIHPCGRYRMNSLTFLLQKEYGYKHLSGCHRIDRPTSGLVIFAKTRHIAGQVHTLIQQRKVEKEYLCKVVGEFPDSTVECQQPVVTFNEKLGFHVAWEVEGGKSKDAWTVFERLSTDGKTSIVLCKPKTGRTHQIRVHLQYLGFPIVNDPVYNHQAWGPERFQHGPVTKNLREITNELTSKLDFESNPHGTKTGVTERLDQFANVKYEASASDDVATPSFTSVPPRVYTGKTAGVMVDGGDLITQSGEDNSGSNVDRSQSTDVMVCEDSKEKNDVAGDDSGATDITAPDKEIKNIQISSEVGISGDLSNTKDTDVPDGIISDKTSNVEMSLQPDEEQPEAINCEILNPTQQNQNPALSKIKDSDFSKEFLQDKTTGPKTCEETSESPTTEYCLPVADSKSRSNTGDWVKVVDCPECMNPLPNPKPESLIMYLHAYRYKSEDWEFQTKVPTWAK